MARHAQEERLLRSCWDTAWLSLAKALNIADGVIACVLLEAPRPTPNGGANEVPCYECVVELLG
jgi:hypothetical protein